MTSWEWPQYLLAFWWAFTLLSTVALRAAGVRFGNKPPKDINEWLGGFLARLISVGVLATVLSFGGFWI